MRSAGPRGVIIPFKSCLIKRRKRNHEQTLAVQEDAAFASQNSDAANGHISYTKQQNVERTRMKGETDKRRKRITKTTSGPAIDGELGTDANRSKFSKTPKKKVPGTRRKKSSRPKKKAAPDKCRSDALADQYIEDFAQYFSDQPDLTFVFVAREGDGKYIAHNKN